MQVGNFISLPVQILRALWASPHTTLGLLIGLRIPLLFQFCDLMVQHGIHYGDVHAVQGHHPRSGCIPAGGFEPSPQVRLRTGRRPKCSSRSARRHSLAGDLDFGNASKQPRLVARQLGDAFREVDLKINSHLLCWNTSVINGLGQSAYRPRPKLTQ